MFQLHFEMCLAINAYFGFELLDTRRVEGIKNKR